MLAIIQRIAYDLYPNTKFTIIDLEYLTSQLLQNIVFTELNEMDDKAIKEELKAISNKIQGA